MSFWEKNREVLLKYYPGLLEELTSETSINNSDDNSLITNNVKIESSNSGEPSLCINGIYIHSARDPVREANRLIESLAGSGPIIILGFGLGYAAQAAAEKISGNEMNRPIIIIEKYKELLRLSFEHRDMSSFLLRKDIIFVPGGTGEGITGALGIAQEISFDNNNGEKKAPSVIKNRALISLDEEWYKTVEEKIRTWSMKDDVNAATLARFGKRWLRNFSRNVTAVRDYPGISGLAGLASSNQNDDNSVSESLPVFLAAAGPGLDKISHLLNDIQKRCIIVAVDTNLRFFNKSNIDPDFVLTVDPQFWNSRHLDRCVCEKTTLIAESAVYPPILKMPFKRILLCGSLFPFGKYIEERVDSKGRLGAGGSVATTAWDFARSLGGKDIWIAGLDLAFPDYRTHFSGAIFEQRFNSSSCRFNPAETWVVHALRDGGPFKARSSNGGQVLTDRRLSLYAAWFENRFSQHHEIRNIRICRDGLYIKGMENAQHDDLLALPDRRNEINKKLDYFFSKIENNFFSENNARKREEQYQIALSELIHGLESIMAAAKSGADMTHNALKNHLSEDQKKKILKNIDEITRRITSSDVKEIAGFLFPRIKEEKAEKDESNPFRSYLNNSYNLFSKLAETTSFALEIMNR